MYINREWYKTMNVKNMFTDEFAYLYIYTLLTQLTNYLQLTNGNVSCYVTN